ncbi:putative DNA repair protein [Trypanosoma grayi]|uniref:putative DNA repair protein n=1 Tax=Trypanosoma grayi TaxID=71804 RepID=UPI0004F46A64|nr:putative DNA repair protein [Trypanosoma grayi]KEG13206.1 putative DNA repair protein [Trypanosoma grayi]
MQPATAPYILRSLYKDEHVVDTHVNRPLTDLVTSAFGAHFTNMYDSHLSGLAKGVYVFFALLRGQTLGEEFCDLLPVTRGNPARLLGLKRKALLALLLALEPVALFRFAIKVFPSLPPHDVIANVHKCTLLLLLLFETYGTLSHRLLGVRYLSLVPSRMLERDDGARGTYLLSGIALLLELSIRLWRFMEERRLANQSGAKRDETQQRKDGVDDESDSDVDDSQRAAAGKCMLCLGNRKQPTATLCGHIFCWRCLSEWIKSNSQGAICPFCRRRITVQSSVPLYFYVAKEPPVVGGVHDTSA